MKTKFTNEEMYNAYSDVVAEYMKEEMKLDSPTVQKIFRQEEFKNKFLQNWKDYEFLEPSKVAKQMVLKNSNLVNVRVVKVQVNNEELVVAVPINRRSIDRTKRLAAVLARRERSRRRIVRRKSREIKEKENENLSKRNEWLV